MTESEAPASRRCGIRDCDEPAYEVITGDEANARCELHSQDPAWKKRTGRKRIHRIKGRVELLDLSPGE